MPLRSENKPLLLFVLQCTHRLSAQSILTVAYGVHCRKWASHRISCSLTGCVYIRLLSNKIYGVRYSRAKDSP
ncbi:hypothetical protein BDV35DRAFT_355543 [Aspergillus flavus]|uniref:Uncharacterized protein n=1 Tax=Aspergillus flavus TaxID=5059 RepID=A0A5N6GXF8_ASPFL|nr:hypothetical protein BDV35DRAFT_355543 [Aspergillus flavus]